MCMCAMTTKDTRDKKDDLSLFLSPVSLVDMAPMNH